MIIDIEREVVEKRKYIPNIIHIDITVIGAAL